MLVLGDAHADEPSNRQALLAAYRESSAAVALQVGDLRRYDLPTPTYFIGGNNEDFDVIDALRNGRLESSSVRNAHLLASTAADVAGVRVAGLSGNFAPTQYEKSRADLSGDRRRHFVKDDVEAVKNLREVDVLLTHEAPTGLIHYGYDPGCERIDELLDALDTELCLVGHYHQHAEATRGETRVVSLAPAWERYYHLDPETLELTSYETPSA